MNKFYICGTNTDVGKTVITSAILQCCKLKNIKTKVVKPVQTGCFDNKSIDIEFHKKTNSIQIYENPCYLLKTPCSPHFAIERESASFDYEKLLRYCRLCCIEDGITLIETAGGIYTPLDMEKNYIDLMSDCKYPIILVTKNVLGMINDTILNVEKLKSLNFEISAIISNSINNPSLDSLEFDIQKNNIEYLKKRYKDIPIISFPFDKDLELKGVFNTKSKEWSNFSSEILPLFDDVSIEEIDIEIDKNNIWHPYTKAISEKACPLVKRARGVMLEIDNKEVIDGMSSWWCAIHGYNNEVINKSIIKQLSSFSHVMFGGLTHKASIDLTKLLLSILPKTLTNIFYCDSGSVSVEVAIKMAIQYQISKNRPLKNKILTVRGGYHGDTFAAMSLCDPINGMHFKFKDILIKQIFVDKPSSRFDEAFNEDSTIEIREVIESRRNEIAALIIEPIVQGAGGMWFYHPQYLKIISKLCKENNILLICDEIATGFGRTGEMFAIDHANIIPDIMCVGKALTGGYLSFAATICIKEIALSLSKDDHLLMHGPTFMGNALACSASIASLTLLKQSNWREKVLNIENILKINLVPLKTNNNVLDVRVLGAIGVVELNYDVNPDLCFDFFLNEGVWIRPFRNLIYIMPPFIIRDVELIKLCNAIKKFVLIGEGYGK